MDNKINIAILLHRFACESYRQEQRLCVRFSHISIMMTLSLFFLHFGNRLTQCIRFHYPDTHRHHDLVRNSNSDHANRKSKLKLFRRRFITFGFFLVFFGAPLFIILIEGIFYWTFFVELKPNVPGRYWLLIIRYLRN